MDRFEYSLHREQAVWDGPRRHSAPALLEERRLGRESHPRSDPSKAAAAAPLQATVTSAVPLTQGELRGLLNSLEQRYKRPISAEVEIKGGFTGGVRVEIGDEVWIGSRRAGFASIKRPPPHADEHSSLNAPLLERGGNGADVNPADRDSHVAPERSMQLGRAIALPSIPALDRYECLQSNLWVRYPATSTKIMLLVGVEKRCGVSTAAANLAASLARNTSARILLVDANVRSAEPGAGVMRSGASDNAEVSLSHLLSDAPVLREPSPGPSNLYVLPSGAPCDLSLSAFQSPPLEELLRKARELFECVIIDAPSLPQHPESLLLARQVDGVILVMESEKTRKQSALWAKRQIEKAGVPLLGVVLNRRKYRVPSWLYKRI